MWNAPALQLPSPPDLLRRFVALPHELCVRNKGLHVHLITNERRIAVALGEIAEECSDDGATIIWTMFCDPHLPTEFNEAIVTDTGDSVFLSFGRACLIAVERKNRNATGFVAAGVLQDGWADVVVPALMAVITDTL